MSKRKEVVSQYDMLVLELEGKLQDLAGQAGVTLKRKGLTRLATLMADSTIDKILEQVDTFREDLQDTVSALMQDLDRKDTEVAELQAVQFQLEETVNYLEAR